jgi:hypothetical protein
MSKADELSVKRSKPMSWKARAVVSACVALAWSWLLLGIPGRLADTGADLEARRD